MSATFQPGFFVSSFGAILVAAIVAGIGFAEFRARRRGFRPGTMISAATFALAGAFVGCRLVPLAVAPEVHLASPAALLALFTTNAGAWYGALGGGVAGLALFARARRLSAIAILDVAAPAIALGKVIGPFACLAAGCDHGRAAPGLPWAVVYSDARSAVSPELLGVPVHPSPLYDALANAAILALLLARERRGARPAGAFALYAAAYAAARLVTETFRGDASRGLFFGGALSTSQIVSIAVLVALAAIVFVRWLKRRPRSRKDPMSDKHPRAKTPWRRRIAAGLVVEGLLLALLLSSFANTENCGPNRTITGGVSYGFGTDHVQRVIRNVSGATKSTDQKIGLRLPNSVNPSAIVLRKNNVTPIDLIDCPPAVRELETLFPTGPFDRWIAFQTPIVTLLNNEFVQLDYDVSPVVSATAIERATALDAEFDCPQAYALSYPLIDPNPPSGGPSLSFGGRAALLVGLVGLGALFLFRRARVA